MGGGHLVGDEECTDDGLCSAARASRTMDKAVVPSLPQMGERP